MPMYYACVVRAEDSLRLSTPRKTPGNYDSMIGKLVAKINPKVLRMSYAHEGKFYHYIADQGLVFLLVADEETPRRTAFGLLEDIKTTFTSMYPEPLPTLSQQTCAEFAAVLEEKLEPDGSVSKNKITAIQNEIDKVRDVMVENLDRVVERGEKIETIVERTEELEASAEGFRRSTQSLRRRAWWRSREILFFVLMFAVLLVALAVWLFS